MPPIDSCAPFFHLPASDATLSILNQLSRHFQVIRNLGSSSSDQTLGGSVAFGIGTDPSHQRPVDWEAETMGDVCQLALQDEYRALPWKILNLLKVASDVCGPVPMTMSSSTSTPFDLLKVRRQVMTNRESLS
ncbi:hypothetical protein CEXT_668731 [Caerostris extrusa]|uniref:Uncharacterized protein n=1 Tax=Caerostris extrusa TaxID=172846 RepID=A0AAV4W4T6_CAEEX|nr:hypothetical protein CEXT_668731 [Caerostris extrusa]